jgi:hypothetical protein
MIKLITKYENQGQLYQEVEIWANYESNFVDYILKPDEYGLRIIPGAFTTIFSIQYYNLTRQENKADITSAYKNYTSYAHEIGDSIKKICYYIDDTDINLILKNMQFTSYIYSDNTMTPDNLFEIHQRVFDEYSNIAKSSGNQNTPELKIQSKLFAKYSKYVLEQDGNHRFYYVMQAREFKDKIRDEQAKNPDLQNENIELPGTSKGGKAASRKKKKQNVQKKTKKKGSIDHNS